jgi:hypothetical protein
LRAAQRRSNPVVLNIVLSATRTYKFGLRGALVGTVISITIGAVMLYVLFVKILKHSMDFINVFFKPLVSVAAAFLINYLIELKKPRPIRGKCFFLQDHPVCRGLFYHQHICLKQFDEYNIDLLGGYLPFLKK